MSTSLPEAVAAFWRTAATAGAAGAGPLVVGVSGGPDSLALLHLLRGLASQVGATLHVAHLDHGWRGAAAQADAEFVAATCAAWDIPCVVRAYAVPEYAARARLSPEDAARRVRYAFLAGVAALVGARAVAVGHNADDQAETVLAHLLRGAGLPGLAGMAPWSPLPRPPDAADLAVALGLPAPARPWLLRPLLGTWRAEIVTYCAALGLHPRDDASNHDPAYRRNDLRLRLLPALERAQPGLARRLWQSAAVFRDENALLEAALDARWPTLAAPEPGRIALRLAAFRDLPPALARRALRRAAAALGAPLDLTWGHVEAARALLGPDGHTGATRAWPGGLRVRRERDRAFVEQAVLSPADTRWPLLTPGIVPLLPAMGTVRLPGWTLSIGQQPWPAGAPAPALGPWAVWFDAAALAAAGGPPVLRTWQPGERMHPLGAPGRRKLQDVLVDAGVPRPLRASLALLAQAGGGVIWVPGPGGRRAALAPIGPATRRVTTFAWTRDEC